MTKASLRLALLFLGMGLTACSSNILNSNQNKVAPSSGATVINAEGQQVSANINKPSNVAIGGAIASSMDEIDRGKLTHALDNAPGKATHWVSSASGTDYTVEPIKKATIAGNGLCRVYQLTAVKNGNKQEMTGTACVGPDGAWHEVEA